MAAPSTSSEPSVAPSPPVAIAAAPALATWTAAWVGGTFVAAPLAIAALGVSLGDDLSISQLAVVSVATWAVMLAMLALAGRRVGTGSFHRDYALDVRPIDLVGIPLGVATQLMLVPAMYVPLRAVWPDTFTDEAIEQRAKDLADSAGGWRTVVLVLVVVVGAPFVEELLYRGLLQRALSEPLGRVPALVATAAFFSLVHFSPVEYPGLFLAGLVFGGCVVATGRLGPAMVTHAAFNATGLVFVLAFVR